MGEVMLHSLLPRCGIWGWKRLWLAQAELAGILESRLMLRLILCYSLLSLIDWATSVARVILQHSHTRYPLSGSN